MGKTVRLEMLFDLNIALDTYVVPDVEKDPLLREWEDEVEQGLGT